MPPELPEDRQIIVGQNGTYHLRYTTTTGDGTETYHQVPLNGTLDHLTPVLPAVEQDINATNDNDFRDLINRIALDYADANIPDTTIYGSDCCGNVWISPNEERIKEIVRETVKELLEQEGYIIGRIPNEISDPPIS